MPFLSFDKHTIYFSRTALGTYGKTYYAIREGTTGSFGEPQVALSSSTGEILNPWVSSDNLRMYYTYENSDFRLMYTERASVSDPWTEGIEISELNSLGSHLQASKLTEDELTIVFNSDDIPGAQGADMWIATRPDVYSAFGNVQNLSELNTTFGDKVGSISPDGLEIYFWSGRNGSSQIFKAIRDSLDDPFGNTEHLDIFDTPGGASAHPAISCDGTELYYTRTYPTGSQSDIYVSYIPEPGTLLLISVGVAFLSRRKD